MQLPVPVVGSEPGPQYATDVNNSLSLIDAHDHTPGNGVQITPSGLNINADLAIGANNLTIARSIRFNSNASPISGAADKGAIYESGVDLYYNDGNGNPIRITASGAIVGTPGSIAGLVSPASATYVAGDSTFVFQSAASTAANIDGGSIILRTLNASSPGLTLSPPSSIASNYSIVLPSLPGSLSFLYIDSSGNITPGSTVLATPGDAQLMFIDASGNIQSSDNINIPGNISLSNLTASSTVTAATVNTSVMNATGTITGNALGITTSGSFGSSLGANSLSVSTTATIGTSLAVPSVTIATSGTLGGKAIAISSTAGANTRIAYGNIASSGVVNNGHGFNNASNPTTGEYVFTFNPAFSDIPAISVTPIVSGFTDIWWGVGGLSATGCTVFMQFPQFTGGSLSALVPINLPFSITAIGQN